MDVYNQSNYKESIKQLVKLRQKDMGSFNLKRLAEKIPLQYTYLSKVLNNDQSHLNEDQLFKVCRILDLDQTETEFILLLRQWEVSQDRERKTFLHNKILKTQTEKQLNKEKFSYQGLSHNQAEYLFNPLCSVVLISLHIKQIRENPLRLCSLLGFTREVLRETLDIIARNHLIETSEDDPFKIKSVKNTHIHIGRDNPLMRVHQNILKMKMASKSYEVSEDNKNSFLVTFTGDKSCFEKINNEFNTFIKKVENIAKDSKHENLYQMSFDLFRWI